MIPLYTAVRPIAWILLCLLSSVSSLTVVDDRHYSINISSISITSYLYHPDITSIPTWAKKIFGNESVFYLKETSRSIAKVTDEEKEQARSKFQEYFHSNEKYLKGLCAIEIGGFTLLEQENPFTFEWQKQNRPSVGDDASLRDHDGFGIQQRCYYRALYENTQGNLYFLPRQYWYTVYYCPIHDVNVCSKLEMKSLSLTPAINLTLSLPLLSGTIWSNNFIMNLTLARRKPISSQYALCNSIPYTTSDQTKRIPNNALIYEWLRYHHKLNFKTILFDRDGNFFNSGYSLLKGYIRESIDEFTVDYHNITVFSLLEIFEREELSYDNSEGFNIVKLLTGLDKRYTLTHCRALARMKYGIEKVLIIDFDEFLYCTGSLCPLQYTPSLPVPTVTNVSFHRLFTLLDELQTKHAISQVIFRQKHLFPRYSHTNVSLCMTEEVHRRGNIFRCFSTYEEILFTKMDKVIHLSYTCPFTSFHYSSFRRHFDCENRGLWIHFKAFAEYRERFGELRECGVIHLTQRASDYTSEKARKFINAHFHSVDRENEMNSKPLELSFL